MQRRKHFSLIICGQIQSSLKEKWAGLQYSTFFYVLIARIYLFLLSILAEL